MELAEAGEFGNVIIDGPLDVRTACEQASGDIKGIVSPINGQADVLIFPNIESGNAFYKSVSLFAQAEMAGLLQGPICQWYFRLVVTPACPNIIAWQWLACKSQETVNAENK